MGREVEELLAKILEELQLLSVKTKSDAILKFNNEFLTTDTRKQAYALFDGEKTLQEISSAIDAKQNTVQVFAQDLAKKDLIDFNSKGNSRLYKPSVTKIAIYYANKSLEDAKIGGSNE